MNWSVQNPMIPYVNVLSQPLYPGQLIKIQGSPCLSPTCFAINLQNGANTDGNRGEVALHLSPVFTSPPRLVRNSIQNHQWGPEESHGPHFPFSPGQSFEIIILTEADEFKIAVNGQHFTEYRYRLPLSSVTHLAVDGDVAINAIKFEAISGHLPSEGKGDITMPIGFITNEMQRSITPPPAYGGPPPPPYGDLSGCMPAYPPTSEQNPYGLPRPSSLYPDTSAFPQSSSQIPSPGSYPSQAPPPQAYPTQKSPYGYPTQGPPYGYPTQGPPYGYTTQGPPHAYPAPSQPHGYPISGPQPYPAQSGSYPSHGSYPASYPSQPGPYPGTSVVYPGSEKEKSDSSSFMGPLAAGAAALAGAAGAAVLSGKHGGKHSKHGGFGPTSLLTEGASALLGGGKHGNKHGSGSFLSDGAAALLGGGKHGPHSPRSSPIPIGGAVAGGAAALAGAYMLSKSPMGHMLKPKKMKKLYKHKHKGKWKHHGRSSSSSSSSSD